MKKLLLALLLTTPIAAIAQPEGRVFTITNQPYTNLATPTIVTTPGWDDFAATVPLGFTFDLMGRTTNTVYFDLDVNYGTEVTLGPLTSATHLITFSADLIDRSIDTNVIRPVSTVGYQTDLIGSNHIAKIEWKDVGFLGDTTFADSSNFQLWIYENSNDIEVHWGPNKILTNPADIFDFGLPFFGIVKELNPANMANPFDYLYYVSNTTTPKVDSMTVAQVLGASTVGFPTYPTNGTVFKFSKTITSTKGTELNAYTTIYPTLFTNEITVAITQAGFKGAVALIDMNGRIVLQQEITNGRNGLVTNDLPAGNYILNINNGKERVFYKITKQ